MTSAFVGHSFSQADRAVVREFTDYFDNLAKAGIGFSWDHAESAEPKELALKVKERIEGKNLFIGICTAKQDSIPLGRLKTIPLFPGRRWSEAGHFRVKTSDWIVQEIGFAVGRGMALIILLESGVEEPGGIQGDIEYIPFQRSKPADSFNKILEMLTALSGAPARGQPADQVASVQETEAQPSTATPTAPEDMPPPEWTLGDYSNALLQAVARKDEAKEREILRSLENTDFGKDPQSMATLRTSCLFWKLFFHKEDTLARLLEILRENPAHPEVLNNVAKAYVQYEQDDQAATYFEKSARVTGSPELKLTRLITASLFAAKVGEGERAVALSREGRAFAGASSEATLEFLQGLASLAEILGQTEALKAFREAVLEQRPDDQERRFALAYAYAASSQHELAAFHYQLITSHKPSPAAWNNLGVARSNLGMPISAVEAYKEAKKLGETLAMSNLAQKYLQAGFVQEAMALVNEATSRETYNQTIGNVLTSLQTAQNNEANTQKQLADSIMPLRRFYASYAMACLSEDVKNLAKHWRGPMGDLEVGIEDGFVHITGTQEQLAIITPAGWFPAAKAKPRENVKYRCRIFGYAAQYEAWTWPVGAELALKAEPANRGILVIDPSLDRIRLLESSARRAELIVVLTPMG
jgi:tetratricopeptide (TPR) repeat protein